MMHSAAAATAGNARPYLGTTAKSINREKKQGLSNATRLNFELQRTAQSLLFRKGAEKQHRTCWCCRTVQGEAVVVKRRTDGSGARLAGVGTCGSVWSCPVCAAKITEARRAELMEGMARAKSLGLSAYLVTLTTPHGKGQEIAELLPAFQKALTHWKNSATYKAVARLAGRAGSIRSLEVTWGEANGWHPHTHDLTYATGDLVALLDHRVKADDPESTIRVQWFKSLKKAGLVTDDQRLDVLEHGIDIRDGTYAAEYVAKYGREAVHEGWGLSGELTKSHAKLGKRGDRYTPFKLLQFAKTGDHQAAALFREFSEAFIGKRMLSYSPKLKIKLGAGELSDEVLAAMDTPMPDEESAGSLSVDDYAEVIKRGAVPDLLDYAATCLTNPDTADADLREWIDWLKTTPARYGGALRQRRHFAPGIMEIYGHA
jgi:hypothetical protein